MMFQMPLESQTDIENTIRHSDITRTAAKENIETKIAEETTEAAESRIETVTNTEAVVTREMVIGPDQGTKSIGDDYF